MVMSIQDYLNRCREIREAQIRSAVDYHVTNIDRILHCGETTYNLYKSNYWYTQTYKCYDNDILDEVIKKYTAVGWNIQETGFWRWRKWIFSPADKPNLPEI
jgi:hypothetical protein